MKNKFLTKLLAIIIAAISLTTVGIYAVEGEFTILDAIGEAVSETQADLAVCEAITVEVEFEEELQPMMASNCLNM